MELAKQAARDSLAQLTDTDEVGLTIFTDGLEGRQTSQELLPVAPLAQNRQQLDAAIAGLQPMNGTPLYVATQAAFDAMAGVSDEQHITGVVLLTDGQNEYNGGVSLDELLAAPPGPREREPRPCLHRRLRQRRRRRDPDPHRPGDAGQEL